MTKLKSRWLVLSACLGTLALSAEAPRSESESSRDGSSQVESGRDESKQADAPRERVLNVIATAYNSTRAQTDAHPNVGGWGDRIEPRMKVLAVSPDLVAAGLKRGTRVRIDGVRGEWIVLDRTPSRLRNHIDLYMGEDVAAARKWGRRRVTIRWIANPG
jgi:3D (Asp-Asp-Asp) domain-containing protein